jgi:hypothetical protein
LMTVPTPCSHEAQFPDHSEASIALTSFCPLMQCIFTVFDAAVANPRGCIAMLRVFSSVATAPRPVDMMVRHITDRLETLIYDSHGNYLVSHVICAVEENNLPPHERVFLPIPQHEMETRTPTILALATGASAKGVLSEYGGGPPRRVAKASPQVWRAFVMRLVNLLASDVVRVGTHREASHILEHAIRRLPFDTLPESCALIDAMTASVDLILRPLVVSACGRHCVQALAETVAQRSAHIRPESLHRCIAHLEQLHSELHRLIGPSTTFESVDLALRRMPKSTAVRPAPLS